MYPNYRRTFMEKTKSVSSGGKSVREGIDAKLEEEENKASKAWHMYKGALLAADWIRASSNMDVLEASKSHPDGTHTSAAELMQLWTLRTGDDNARGHLPEWQRDCIRMLLKGRTIFLPNAVQPSGGPSIFNVVKGIEIDDKVEMITRLQRQSVFDQLKAALISAPVLDLPFIVDTDASDKGIGGVLSQVQDGHKRCDPAPHVNNVISAAANQPLPLSFLLVMAAKQSEDPLLAQLVTDMA
ncbi:Hypp8222 [Branchiostoma lanceolatum]|uniref:Hypp8222 protein n=1 Tax=Branchiostoma lanceolatum TaxID=7740 RepID=A0A8K0EED3_BRALA|nr:Hypp8222 [Branchiostoma lanceolatum]